MSYEAGNISTIQDPRYLGAVPPQCAKYRGTSKIPPVGYLTCITSMNKCGKVSCQGGVLSQIGKALIAPVAVATFAFGGPLIAKALVGVGRAAVGVGKGAASFVGKQLVPSKPTPQSFFGPPAPAGASVPEGPSIPSGPSVPPSGMTTADFMGPPAPSFATADQAGPTEAGVAAPSAKMNPLAIVGVAAALLLAFSPKPKARR
jgi:hypothetical protein